LLVLGTELARRGDESGLGQLDLGLGLLIEEGNQGGASLGLALLADAQLHLGRFEQAIATADAGLATSASLRQPFYDPELLRLKALALDEESGNRTQAVALLEQSLALAQQLGARSWALTTATSLALLLGRAAGGARAREVLTGALAVMGDGGATVAQQRARALLGQLP
jgi:tetratricopeptide (TPR) repeat protein